MAGRANVQELLAGMTPDARADFVRRNPAVAALEGQRHRACPPSELPELSRTDAARARHAVGGRAAQRHGAAGEVWFEEALDSAEADGFLAWWRHFHPPYVRVAGEWRPRALEPGSGSVDYLVQPFEGPGVLVEVKSTDEHRFALAQIPEHQVEHLDAQVRAGLPAALVVTFRAEGLRVVCPWARAPWRTERTAPALYAEDPAVVALAVSPGDVVERLLAMAGVRPGGGA